jgi:RHS repeat-associated protein
MPTPTCLPQFGGGSIESRDGESFEGVGETRLTTGTIFTDKLFTGQREMAGLGIYHYGARFYSPKLGRFLSPDTIVPGYTNPQAYNRYSYVLNNPLRYIDPSGHSQCQTQEDCDDMGTTPMGTGNPHNGGGGDGGRDGCRHNDPDCQGDGEGKGFGVGPKIGPGSTEPPVVDDPFSGVTFWLQSYNWGNLLQDSALFMDNYGVPTYRHAKGVVPGGFWLEFGLGAFTTALSDLNNPNFTWEQKAVRSLVVGVEDGLIDRAATAGGSFVASGAGLGSLGTGPGAAVAAGVAFFGTSVVISEALDFVAGGLNQKFLPGYFPP